MPGNSVAGTATLSAALCRILLALNITYIMHCNIILIPGAQFFGENSNIGFVSVCHCTRYCCQLVEINKLNITVRSQKYLHTEYLLPLYLLRYSLCEDLVENVAD